MKCDYKGTHYLNAQPGDKIPCPNCGKSVIVMRGHGDKLLIPAHQWPEYSLKIYHHWGNAKGA